MALEGRHLPILSALACAWALFDISHCIRGEGPASYPCPSRAPSSELRAWHFRSSLLLHAHYNTQTSATSLPKARGSLQVILSAEAGSLLLTRRHPTYLIPLTLIVKPWNYVADGGLKCLSSSKDADLQERKQARALWMTVFTCFSGL